MKQVDWTKYYAATANDPPSRLAKEALERTSKRTAALDLGAGSGRNTRLLISEKFEKIFAVEPSHHAPHLEAAEGVELIYSKDTLETFFGLSGPPKFELEFDLILCLNTFFFIKKEDVHSLLIRMGAALAHGGVIAFNVLGGGDEWALDGREDISWFNDSEIAAIEEEFHPLYSSLETEYKKTALGTPKLWQTYSMVCVRE